MDHRHNGRNFPVLWSGECRDLLRTTQDGKWPKDTDTQEHPVSTHRAIIQWYGYNCRDFPVLCSGECRDLLRSTQDGKWPKNTKTQEHTVSRHRAIIHWYGHNCRDFPDLCSVEIFLKWRIIEWYAETLNIKLRKILVSCYVWSIDLYGSETWTLRILELKYLESFEMWCWRRM